MVRKNRRASFLAALAAAAILMASFPAEAVKIEADEIPTGLPLSVNLYGVSWKPSGSEALAVGDTRTVVIYKDSTASFRSVDAPSAPNFIMDVAWDPAGAFALAVGSGGGAFLWNGQTITPVATGSTAYLYGLDWWPGGAGALVVGSSGTILRYAGGVFSPLASGVDVQLMDVSCRSTDGSALVVGLNSTFLRVAADGTVTKLTFEGDWSLYSVSWNPEGTSAVITGGNGIIATYDGTAVKFINRDVPYTFLGSCWRPDGACALICGDTGTILKMQNGRLTLIDPGIRSLIQGIAYRPDGSYALAVGNKAKCVRYPKKPAEKPPGLLDNPFVLGGIVAVVAIGIAYAAVKDRRDRKAIPSGPAKREGRSRERRRH